MNYKLVAFIVCAGYGIWFAAIGGKVVRQEHVETLYQEYQAAFERGDGSAVCSLFSNDVHGRFTSTSRSMPVKEVVDKASACSSVKEFHASKKKMEEAVGHELYTNFDFTIKSISIDPGKRTARAEVLMELRVGTEQGALLDMRTTQVDVIKRSLGKTQIVQSDGTVSFYR